MSSLHPRCMVVSNADKAGLRLLFLARHAFANGDADATDGNHAVYHHELRTTLERVGFNVTPAASYEALYERPDADFVVPLLNRGGFTNSEMLAPLLLARHGLPFLGASPILRGLADDKHLSKLAARQCGVPTADWRVYRRGGGPITAPAFRDARIVVKPNASSASWGIHMVDGWSNARGHVESLLADGHDVIVEPWTPLLDVAVPVIGGSRGRPWILPPMMYLPADPNRERSYEEKRGLIDAGDDPLVPVADPRLVAQLDALVRALLPELWPFDYGRFEFRYDPATGALSFMEVNVSCNLWSRKTISRSAATLGIDHASLVETIVAHSLARQGLIDTRRYVIAA